CQPASLPGLGIEAEGSEGGVRLHCRMGHLVCEIPAFDNVRGLAKALLGIAKDVVIILLDVVRLLRVDDIGTRLHRLFGIKVCRQELVLDLDQLERLLCNRFRFGYYTRDVVAYIANLVHGQRGFIVSNGKNAVLVRGILSSHDSNDSIECKSASCINTLDKGVGMR